MQEKTKILITGASGFLGGRLAQELSKKLDYEVIATGRDKEKGKALEAQGINFISGDLAQAAFVAELMQGIDAVVHCAALSSPWGAYKDFYTANIQSAENLLAAAEKENIKRFVQISTPSIYVQYQHQLDIKEDFLPPRFINHYAATKYEAEKRVLASAQKGMETVILRPRAIYGAGDYTIMPRILRAYEQGRLKIIGKGDNVADMTSVANVCEAILLALETQKKEALGQAYNITNGAPMPLWEIIELVFAAMKLPWQPKHLPYKVADTAALLMETWAKWTRAQQEPVLTRYGIAAIHFSTTLNIDKAKNLLGYSPSQTNLDGINEFVDWYEKNKI
jgi:nucleoside-diphosphate-sugar epimerase